MELTVSAHWYSAGSTPAGADALVGRGVGADALVGRGVLVGALVGTGVQAGALVGRGVLVGVLVERGGPAETHWCWSSCCKA
jgi:hypothetical protein